MIYSINLLPWRNEAARKLKRRFFTLSLCGALLFLILQYIIYNDLALNVLAKKENLAQLAIKTQTLDRELRQLTSYQTETDLLKQQLKRLSTLERGKGAVSLLFILLPNMIQDEIYLKALVIDGGHITLTGVSHDAGSLNTMLTSIQQNLSLYDFKIDSITSTKQSSTTQEFTLSFRLRVSYPEDEK